MSIETPLYAGPARCRINEAGTSGWRTSPPGSRAFDWAVTLLSAVFLGGVFLDGWAHTHGRIDDSFFTPWHAVLYSGYLAVAILLLGALVRNIVRGHPWRQALPDGYRLSLLGVALWAAGVPALLQLAYFGSLLLTDGIGWSAHLWLGSIVLCGIVGWLLSYLLVPPRTSLARQ